MALSRRRCRSWLWSTAIHTICALIRIWARDTRVRQIKRGLRDQRVIDLKISHKSHQHITLYVYTINALHMHVTRMIYYIYYNIDGQFMMRFKQMIYILLANFCIAITTTEILNFTICISSRLCNSTLYIQCSTHMRS